MGRRKAGSKVAQKAATVTASHSSNNAKVTAEKTSLPRENPTPTEPYTATGSTSPEAVVALPKEDSSEPTPTFVTTESANSISSEDRVTSNGYVAKEAAVSTNGTVTEEPQGASFKKAAQPQPQKQAAPAFTLSPFALLRSFLLFIVTSILSQLAVLWEKPLKVVGGAGPLNDYILERLPLLRTPYR